MIIYIYTNKINGKSYVGQTTQTLKSRQWQHIHCGTLLGRAIRDDGVENFRVDILECESQEELNKLEKIYIKLYDSLYPNGYNLQDGGKGMTKHSEQTKKKLSALMMGNTRGLGNRHTKETKDVMRKSKMGSRNPQSKLSELETRFVKLWIKREMVQTEIAKKFSISPSTICDIKYGRTRNNTTYPL